MLLVRRVVAVFLPHLHDFFVGDVRRRYDPLSSLLPPHFTLVFPHADARPTHDVKQRLQAAMAEVAAFHVRLDDVTAHGEFLFLNVKRGNDALIALHDRLYRDVFPGSKDVEFTFVPHVTVGRVEDRSERLEALRFARSVSHAVEVVVDEVTLYRVDGQERPVEAAVRLQESP